MYFPLQHSQWRLRYNSALIIHSHPHHMPQSSSLRVDVSNVIGGHRTKFPICLAGAVDFITGMTLRMVKDDASVRLEWVEDP